MRQIAVRIEEHRPRSSALPQFERNGTQYLKFQNASSGVPLSSDFVRVQLPAGRIRKAGKIASAAFEAATRILPSASHFHRCFVLGMQTLGGSKSMAGGSVAKNPATAGLPRLSG
jgi:hypothetical protein